jgi:hypothetical protein
MAQDGTSRSASTRVDGSPSGKRFRASPKGWGYWSLAIFGLCLAGLWVGLFVESARQDRLALGKWTWVPLLPCLGGDFKLNIDHIVRVQALGFKPHQVPSDIYCALYPYPPMIARYFRWVTLFDEMTASVVWQCGLVAFVGLGCMAAWRTRRSLGLGPIPWMLMVVVVLFSSPFVFVLERGQCDPMIIPLMLVVAWLLGRRGTWAELGAGGLLGLTAWIKYYPGLAVVALLALGRKKAMVTFVGVVAFVGLVDFEGVRESIKAGKTIEGKAILRVGYFHPSSHSLQEYWRLNSLVHDSPVLSRVPAPLPAALMLLPALWLVSRGIARSKDNQPLIFPYLLWLAATATFALPYANDYNLVTLPIAILAVWDRRDRAAVHVALALSILWLQPAWLPISGNLLFPLKVGALYAAGACLVARANGTGQAGDILGESRVSRPAFARMSLPLREAPGSPRP